MRIKKDDPVIIIAGPQAGTKTKIIATYPKEGLVKAEGIAMITKYNRQTGEKIQFERKISVSNVAYDAGGKPSRIGYKVDKNGKKVRIAKKTGQEIK